MPDWLTADITLLLWRGLALTLALTAVTSFFAMLIGVIAGTLRLANRGSWHWLAGVHIGIHRNVPALVLILFWAFAVPNLFPISVRQRLFFDNSLARMFTDLTGVAIPYYLLASATALTLNSSAYLAELFRAGVGTISQQHIDAARSLGATRNVVFWRILLPRGLGAAFPAISTRLVHNMKNTALAAFVAVPEFFQGTQTAVTRTFLAVEFLTLAAVVYLTLSVLFVALLRAMEQLLRRRSVSSLFRVA